MGNDQLFDDFFAGLIERIKGLVKQPQFGRRHEQPAERDPALLPGREPARHYILHAGKTEPFKDGAAIGIFPATAKAPYDPQIFPRGQGRFEAVLMADITDIALKKITALMSGFIIPEDLPRAGLDQARADLQQAALAAAVRAIDLQQFPAAEAKADALK